MKTMNYKGYSIIITIPYGYFEIYIRGVLYTSDDLGWLINIIESDLK